MRQNFDRSLREILQHEGGYVNDPQDPGGRTNLGVTQAVYEKWIGHKVDEKIMRGLTPQLVGPLYKKEYWAKVRGDELPIGLDLSVFDFAVNAGVSRAGRYLQRVVGLPAEQQDGVVGPKTIAATTEFVRNKGLLRTIERYADARREYYPRLPHFPRFGRGWMRRVEEVEKEALAMAKAVGYER